MVTGTYQVLEYNPSSSTPRTCIDCRQCKRSVIEAIGLSYIRSAKSYLQQGQLLVLAGCFSGENQHTATVITGGDVREGESTYPSPDENYKSSALEVDQRIW